MHFDQTWVENRKRYRKTLKGTRLTVDPVTGYLEPSGRLGFSSEDRRAFVERFKVCSNITGIAKSLGIDIATVYDAIAVDDKFREDINRCNTIPNRTKNLNRALEVKNDSRKQAVISELISKLK